MGNERTKKRSLSDYEIVLGIQSDSQSMKAEVERTLFFHCKQYFDDHYQSLFFVDEEPRKDIFQESFIQLWQNIERRKIYVEDGTLKGKKGEEFEGSLTTYLMSIARLKYLEWVREEAKYRLKLKKNKDNQDNKDHEDVEEEFEKWILYGDEEDIKLEIISYCISHMSQRCNEILTRFYYRDMSLNEILADLPTYNSKDALKTEKHKCMKRLESSAKDLYNRMNAK